MKRRDFLAAMTAAGTLCTAGFLVTPAKAAADVLLGSPERERTLWLHRPDTFADVPESDEEPPAEAPVPSPAPTPDEDQ